MDEHLTQADAAGTAGGAGTVHRPARAGGSARTGRTARTAQPARTARTVRPTRRGPLGGVPTAAVAAGTLVGAFAVAQGTGVRALGGAVLVAGVGWCVWRALPGAGVSRVGAVVGLGAVCFVASHLLAPTLGAWPSVLLVAAVLAAGTLLLVDRGPASAPARR